MHFETCFLQGFQQSLFCAHQHRKSAPNLTHSAVRIAMTDNPPPVWSDIRLPASITPSLYELTVQPDLVNEPFSFQGTVVIHLHLAAATTDIVVHMVNINIDAAALRVASAQDWREPDDIVINHVQEYVVFRFFQPEKLQPGDYQLRIDYNGLLGQDLLGFYNSSYVDADGVTHNIATTKFEPTYARRAFPCLDEPAMKASYIVNSIANITLTPTVLSNMPEASRKQINGDIYQITFQPSLAMSTYLVAFIFCDFVGTSLPFHGGAKNVTVWTRPDAQAQGLFSLQVAQNCTDFYESYFEIDFPLPKMDLIGIPDFISGAMENWGLITFRETSFLIDDSQSSASDKQRTALTVCHELAHQWFGDLVTMRWWNDLWLNEGFASFLEYHGVDHAFPDWQMNDQFVTADMLNAFDADSLPVTHAISVNITNPAQINSLFDSISYDKGASILRMLSAFLDSLHPGQPSVFQSGLANYLNEHKYNNAETSDLWASLSAASQQPVATIMSAWTDSEGFPFVSAQLTTPSTIVLTQERFYQYPQAGNSTNTPQVWWIPLNYQTDTDANPVSFPMPLVQQSNPLAFNSSWIKFNVGQTAVCRVRYDSSLLLALKNTLAADLNALAPVDRAGLVADTLSFMRSQYVTPTDALRFTSVLQNETNYVVWQAAVRYLTVFEPLLRLQECYGQYRAFIQSLILTALNATGGVPSATVQEDPLNDSQTDILLRSLAIDTAGRFGHQPTLQAARALFFADLAGTVTISSNLRSAIYNAAMASDQTDDNDTVYHSLIVRYIAEASNPTERNRIIAAMARSSKPYILYTVLTWTLDPSLVRVQDVISVVVAVAAGQQGLNLAWDFFQQNFAFFNSKFGERMATLVTGVTKDFTMQANADEINQFFQLHPVASAALAVQQSTQRIASNEAWISKNADETCGYLFAA
ncbi:protease m1 zinc metalloprotease [Capsaspora owczarzaki ATCC 30864]|uniref:Aminopeptidase n=1 Tax=Capsaspora owczarzaki (strain ATCC 30864) TaxID=595528 RepID=A0A0D2VR80_CAPO3|nr:protease m1 zinc metalloprotease [Capsaspora owczarzaki ATCC 30864]